MVSFIRKPCHRGNPKELWQVINRILHPNPQPLKVESNLLTNHFTSNSQRLLGSTPNSPHALQERINSISDSSTSSLDLRPVTYCEVQKQLKNMRSDCSPELTKYLLSLKVAADHVVSPLTQIINSFISNDIFPAAWRMARVSPIPKVDSPIYADQYRP